MLLADSIGGGYRRYWVNGTMLVRQKVEFSPGEGELETKRVKPDAPY